MMVQRLDLAGRVAELDANPPGGDAEARIAELRALLLDAHDQLLRRDGEIERLRVRESDLQKEVARWIHIVEARDEGIRFLRGEVDNFQRIIAARDEAIEYLRLQQQERDRTIEALREEVAHLRDLLARARSGG